MALRMDDLVAILEKRLIDPISRRFVDLVAERYPDITRSRWSLGMIHGTASPIFGSRLVEHLRYPTTNLKSATPVDLTLFSNGNIEPLVKKSVRHWETYVVQSGGRSLLPNRHEATKVVSRDIIELLLLISAVRDSANGVVAVCPYLPYARSDKKDKARNVIGASLMTDLIMAAGASRIVTMDLHSMQVQGFSNIPMEQLFATRYFIRYFVEQDIDWDEFVVIAPDTNAAKTSRWFAEELAKAVAEKHQLVSVPIFPIVIINKRRVDDTETPYVTEIIGEDKVPGKTGVLIDDEILSARTMVIAAKALRDLGLKRSFAAATHGVFSGHAIDRLNDSPFEQIVVTDTIDLPDPPPSPKIVQLSVAGLMGEAIKRIHAGRGDSISELCK